MIEAEIEKRNLRNIWNEHIKKTLLSIPLRRTNSSDIDNVASILCQVALPVKQMRQW